MASPLLPHLPAARGRRASDANLTAEEVAALGAAAELVRALSG
ncbi:hypothetical protein ACF07V_27690 [Streptomyces sp. NPDC015661]